jgi:hypothetical protein
MLLERSEVIDRPLGLDFVELLAVGFGHGHGILAGSDQEVSARLGAGSAPVDGGNGEMVEAGFAGVAGDASDFSRARAAQIRDCR